MASILSMLRREALASTVLYRNYLEKFKYNGEISVLCSAFTVMLWKEERKMNGWRQYSIRVEGKNMVPPSARPWRSPYRTTNHSILWAIVHGIFSWLYVICFALFWP
jgi:hypothetical protein